MVDACCVLTCCLTCTQLGLFYYYFYSCDSAHPSLSVLVLTDPVTLDTLNISVRFASEWQGIKKKIKKACYLTATVHPVSTVSLMLSKKDFMKKVHIFSISALRTLFVTLSNGAVIWLQTDSLQLCLTRSLTFCQTSGQKSCFWPFSQFRLFDRHCQPSVWNGQFGSLFCKFSHTKLFSNNFFFFSSSSLQ